MNATMLIEQKMHQTNEQLQQLNETTTDRTYYLHPQTSFHVQWSVFCFPHTV